MIPVYITSKGRPECLTAQHLKKSYIVIEPQDIEDYKDKCPPGHDLIVIPKNDMGLVYVRNFILDHAISNGHDLYWVLDDDLSFCKQVGNRAVKCEWDDVRKEPEDLMTRYPDKIGLIGTEYRSYMWSAKKKWNENAVCDCCVLVNTRVAKKGVRYDPRFKLKVDRDFTLQVKKSGMRVIKYCIAGFSCPTNGSNVGGLFDVYKSQVEEEMSLLLCAKWKGIVSMNYKKSGRPDAKIHWNKI